MAHKALKLLPGIPRGKLTTYAELAKACKTSPRAIGSIMKHNARPNLYPCYKVVKSDGTLGGYSGAGSKAAKLRQDGIPIVGNRIPNFERYVFRFPLAKQKHRGDARPRRDK